MTSMKEIKKMSEKDLSSMIEEKREVVRSFRFGAGSRDVRAVRTAKKDIARALTELNTRGETKDKVENK